MSNSYVYMVCHYLAHRQEEIDQEIADLKRYDFDKSNNAASYAQLAILEAKKETVDRMTTDLLKILQCYDK